ncbi:MAG: hypothetical protein J6Y29_05620 [Clostridiales bacterium]|nr:hypothetical protein [Clostridiales bacterium]
MSRLVARPKSITSARIRVVETTKLKRDVEKFWNIVTKGRVARSLQNSQYIKVSLRSGLILVLKRKGTNGKGTIDISVSTKKVMQGTRLKDQRIHFVEALEE